MSHPPLLRKQGALHGLGHHSFDALPMFLLILYFYPYARTFGYFSPCRPIFSSIWI